MVYRGQDTTLCESSSAASNYYRACYTCVDTRGDNATVLPELHDIFAPFIDFCESANTTTPAIIDTSWLAKYTTFTPATLVFATAFGGESYSRTLYQPVTRYSTVPEYFFHLSVGSMISSYLPSSILSELAHSVSLSAAAASVTGDATSLIHAALEATSVPSWFSAAVPVTYSSQMHTLQEQINQLRATPVSLAPVPTSSPTSSDSSSPASPSASTPSTGE